MHIRFKGIAYAHSASPRFSRYLAPMSTLDTFRQMTGITQTSHLEITPERAQEIIQEISSCQRDETAATQVTLLPVATYISQSKEEDAGSAYVYPKQPPFAAHWGIVVGDPNKRGDAFLLHLVLRDREGNRRIEFRSTGVDSNSEWLIGAAVAAIGETKFTIQELRRIGEDMIDAFGNYHVVFWNCQMFAKCYLRVITGSEAAFTQWTSADVTNLFLCALVVPMPLASTSRSIEKRKTKQLDKIGRQVAVTAVNSPSFVSESHSVELNEKELHKLSDETIDRLKEAWRDDETLTLLSRPVKDSSDKTKLIDGIKALLMRALGYES